MEVFEASSYKDYLEFRAQKVWGARSKMAAAIGCQSSHISRVILGHVHLTNDQAFELVDYWGLSSLDKDYFLTLVELERSASSKHKEHLQAKLKRLKQQNDRVDERISDQTQSLSELEQLSKYYGSWLPSAVHIGVAIPSLQVPQDLSDYLGVSEVKLLSVLEFLEAQGLIRKVNDKYEFSSSSLYVGKESPFANFYQSAWRNKATLEAQRMKPESVHYSGVITLSRRSFEQVKEQVLAIIEKASQLSDTSDPETLAVLNLDFFDPGER